MDLTTAHAIITGGSSGIGLATAQALAARGARLSLLARGPERLDAAAAELGRQGRKVVTVPVDVTDQAAVTAAFAKATDVHGPCDVLVTSAGLAHPGYFEQLDDANFRNHMEVNFFGTLYAVRAVVPAMIERRAGSIVGVSSAAGLIGIFGYTGYAASKFAVRGFFESLRAELLPYAVHVGCAFPPDVDTPMLEYENQFKPAETRAIAGTIKPLRAETVAASILRGIERRQFAIIPDVTTKALARAAGLFSGTLAAAFDRKVQEVRRNPQADTGAAT